MRITISLFSILAITTACQARPALHSRAEAPAPAHVLTHAAATVPVGPVFWVVDGRRLGVDSTGAIAASVQRLDPKSIRNVEVLKGRRAIEMFGDEASGGVVIVTTDGRRPSGE